MAGKGDFLGGVVLGSLIGAALGLLFAPASGADTRALIAEKGVEAKKLAVGKVKAKSGAAREACKEMVVELKRRIPGLTENHESLDTAGKASS